MELLSTPTLEDQNFGSLNIYQKTLSTQGESKNFISRFLLSLNFPTIAGNFKKNLHAYCMFVSMLNYKILFNSDKVIPY